MADSSQRQFLFAHLRGTSGGGWQAVSTRFEAVLANWPQAARLGLFMGLFGLSNQDLFAMLSLARSVDQGEQATADLRCRLPADIELVDCQPLLATVRPRTDAPLTRAGIYIFRFYDVLAEDVDEVVTLSDTTWQGWKGENAYPGEPMGLFRFADSTLEHGRMLLLTWYDTMTSWESSRSSHISVSANLTRREMLSRSITAYATRLTEVNRPGP